MWRNLVNNKNPRFRAEIVANKNMVAQFGADSISQLNRAVNGYLKECGRKRTLVRVYEPSRLGSLAYYSIIKGKVNIC